MDYLHVSIKLLIGVIYAIIIMKITGKGNLSPLSPFDQINNYILGGIVGSVLFNKSISIIDFIFVLSLWGIINLIITYLRKKSTIVRKAIDGLHIDVIQDGKIIRRGIEQAKINIPDLYLRLKIQGIYDIKDVNLATIETNGQLTCVKKTDLAQSIIPLVIDKVIYTDNLKLVKTTEDDLITYITENGYSSFDDVAGIDWVNHKFSIVEFI